MNSYKKSDKRDTTTRPLTGDEYLESLRDGREVWIYGERVEDVTTHPAFRNSTRMIARLYDALHDPETKDVLTCETDTGSGGYTHPFFKASRSAEDMVAARDAIAAWQRITYGWMGRSPDYKACFTGVLPANAELCGPYQENALRWYKECQEKVLYLNHTVVNPPVDRHLPPNEVNEVYIHVKRETDAGLIVSGAKAIATNAALTHMNFAFRMGENAKEEKFAVAFLAPMNTPGLKLICRPSYELVAGITGSPFDYPLSSRFDENDAIFILDEALIPWENVLYYEEAQEGLHQLLASGMEHRFCLHGCTRLAVKLDFIAGLLLLAVETTGVDQFRGVQVNVGEVMAWRNLFWGLSDAMARTVQPSKKGTVLPNHEYALAYRVMMGIGYSKIREIIENLIASGLIYQPSSTLDFKTPALRPYLDKYVRGSKGVESVERIKLMKLLWDAVGTEFAGRHELYERNYGGGHEIIRMVNLFTGLENGSVDKLKGFAKQCMAEYDLDGWTAPDLFNPDDLNYFTNRKHWER